MRSMMVFSLGLVLIAAWGAPFMAQHAEAVPDGIALLPVRDPLLSNPSPGATSNDGTNITIADSNIIITGTKVAEMVHTIEDVVARDDAHDDDALVGVILGIMGVEQPDQELKTKIRVALVLRRDPALSADLAKRAFHDRLVAIVSAADATAKADDASPSPVSVQPPPPSTRSTGSSSASSSTGVVLQPLTSVIGSLL